MRPLLGAGCLEDSALSRFLAVAALRPGLRAMIV
jgi:hypothetical protein